MNSGVIGRVEGSFKDFDSFGIDNEEGLQQVVDVRKKRTTESGLDVIIGAAAKQKSVKNDSVQFDGTSVEEVEITETAADYTEFIAIPGEFVIVGSGSGTFAFDFIARQTGSHIERASIDIDGFLDQLDNHQTWKVGFYDHFGMADNGTLYGNNILDDEDFGEIMGIADKNQIGLTYADGSDTKYKVNMTESGYLEVYSPDLDSEEFAEFVAEKVYENSYIQ